MSDAVRALAADQMDRAATAQRLAEAITLHKQLATARDRSTGELAQINRDLDGYMKDARDNFGTDDPVQLISISQQRQEAATATVNTFFNVVHRVNNAYSAIMSAAPSAG